MGHTYVYVSSDLHVQAAVSESMALLMNKLDELNEGTQEVQNANFPHPDVANADQEQEGSMVSQAHLNKVLSDLFIWCFQHLTQSVLCRHPM